MTSKFLRAMTSNDVLGENLMPAHSTTNSALVDLLFQSGSARHWDVDRKIKLFTNALGVDKVAAIVLLFYARDIRQGQGERDFFRHCFNWLARSRETDAQKVLKLIPEYGRWDDIFYSTEGTRLLDLGLLYLIKAVREGNGLAAKWAPREGKSTHRFFERIMQITDLSEREYRKLVAKVSNTVEDKMCAQEWEEINYNHVPSRAFLIYKNAFLRHDTERFREWLDSLSNPESKNKVHADTLYPYDLVRKLLFSARSLRIDNLSSDEIKSIQAQWEALPDYESSKEGVMVMSDMSGSMASHLNGLPMFASIGLGIYFSERLKGPFKNLVMTFSERPYFIELPEDGKLVDKIAVMTNHRYVQNTNLEAGLQLMLTRAKEHNLNEEDMPKVLLILSDMQFDGCTGNPTLNGLEMIREYYRIAGYKCPHVVFWNLRATGTAPAKKDEKGVTLISGYSPATMQFILKGVVTPEDTLREIILSKRYAPIIEALME